MFRAVFWVILPCKMIVDRRFHLTAQRALREYFTGIKFFNKLPSELKQLVNFPKKFKRTLRRYLVSHCFIA
jgi:hypothetical protein